MEQISTRSSCRSKLVTGNSDLDDLLENDSAGLPGSKGSGRKFDQENQEQARNLTPSGAKGDLLFHRL